jgi:hypothetical protein
MTIRDMRRFIDDLLHQRRGRRTNIAPEHDAELRTAILLRSARPGAGAPREEFVTELHERLANELNPEPAPVPLARRRHTDRPFDPSGAQRHWDRRPASVPRTRCVAHRGRQRGPARGRGTEVRPRRDHRFCPPHPRRGGRRVRSLHPPQLPADPGRPGRPPELPLPRRIVFGQRRGPATPVAHSPGTSADNQHPRGRWRRAGFRAEPGRLASSTVDSPQWCRRAHLLWGLAPSMLTVPARSRTDCSDHGTNRQPGRAE